MQLRKFYVIGVYSAPWVLNPEGARTLSEAQHSVRWQGGNSADWAIARRTGPDTFEERGGAGRTFTVQRGPYTDEAFDRFKSEWGES